MQGFGRNIRTSLCLLGALAVAIGSVCAQGTPTQDTEPGYWTKERVEQLAYWIPALGGLSEGNFSAQEFVDREAYRQLYIAHEHALPYLETIGLTHPDWSVRASSVHLIAQLASPASRGALGYVCKRGLDDDLEYDEQPETNKLVVVLAAQGLAYWHGDKRYVRRMFPPVEDPDDGGEESPSHPLLRWAEAMYNVRPNLSETERSILISDLAKYLDRKTRYQEIRDKHPQYRPESWSPAYRLTDFGEAGREAVLNKYWTTSEPTTKENALRLLNSAGRHGRGFRKKDERYFDVLEDAVQSPDKYLRWEVYLALDDTRDPRIRALYDRLRHDPWDRIRDAIAREDAWAAEYRVIRETEERRKEEQRRLQQEGEKRDVIWRRYSEQRRQEYMAQPELTIDSWVKKMHPLYSPSDWERVKQDRSPEEWNEILAAAEKLGVKIELLSEEGGETSESPLPPATSARRAAPTTQEPLHKSIAFRLVVLGGLALVLFASVALLRRRKSAP